MSDKRTKTSLKDFRLTIIKILKIKPMQAKELRSTLDKEGVSYSRDRLNDLLNLMIDSGDIERKIINTNPYPVYSILKKSKLLAEFNGILFGDIFQYSMFHGKHLQNLLDEFEKTPHKKTRVDAMLEYLGFIVMGSLLAGKVLYEDKEQRSDWLKPVLDLEHGWGMSKFFDDFIDDKILIKTMKELYKNYPQNMSMLEDCVETQSKINDLIEGNEDEMKVISKKLVDFYNEK